MSWSPDMGQARALAQFFTEFRMASDDKHKQMVEALEQYKRQPEFSNYLAFLLGLPDAEVGPVVRQLAGLVLKNHCLAVWSHLPAHVKEYVKAQCLKCIGDVNHGVRNAVGTIVTSIATATYLDDWPDLPHQLLALLGHADSNTVDGAFNALSNLCEDVPAALNGEDIGRPANTIIQRLFPYYGHSHTPYRRYAVACINALIIYEPPALTANLDKYMEGMARLSTDPDPLVRSAVIEGLALVLGSYLHRVHPHLGSITEFVLAACDDSDPQVAKQACDWWSTFLEDAVELKHLLEPLLPRLLPALLRNTAFRDDDDAIVELQDGDDAAVPDDASSIAPSFHSTRVVGFSGAPATSSRRRDGQGDGSGAAAAAGAAGGGDDDSDSDDDDDDDDDDDAPPSSWTPRKAAAAAIDALSVEMPDKLLPVLLPLLDARLKAADDWRTRESGVLVLGAISSGCHDALSPHMHQLAPFLESLMRDPHPLLRSVTAWCMGRFAQWYVDTVASEGRDRFFGPAFRALLATMLDRSKQVQATACSAVAVFTEYAGAEVAPYTEEALATFSRAFAVYQAANERSLLDAVGTLVQAAKESVNTPKNIHYLLPPIIHKWHSYADDDKRIPAIFECLTVIVPCLGASFAEFAGPVFERAVRVIEHSLPVVCAAEDQNVQGTQEEQALAAALDLVSGLLEGLRGSMVEPIKSSPLLALLNECTKLASMEARQGAYAVLGEMAKECMPALAPSLPHFLPCLHRDIKPIYGNCCNNAMWALGEVAISVGGSSSAFAAKMVPPLVGVLEDDRLKRDDEEGVMLRENAAVSLGRLSMVCPAEVAPFVGDFLDDWLFVIARMEDGVEKEHAYYGLCLLIKAAPATFVPEFKHVVKVFVCWRTKPPGAELVEMMRQIVVSFKEQAGDKWPGFIASLDDQTPRLLNQAFGV